MKRLWLVVAVLLGSAMLSAGALPAPGTRPAAKAIRTYLAKTTVQIRAYQSLGKRLEEVLSAPPEQDLSGLVQDLRDVAADFEGLARNWKRIAAPPSLRGSHQWMAAAFHLQAGGLTTWADAFEQYAFDGDVDALTSKAAEAKARLSDAGALQKAWAGAVRAAARRAHVTVPRWLSLMAKGG
jgi:hypothetical protein